MARPSCGVNNPTGTPSSTAIVTGVAGGLFTVASAASTIKGIVSAGSAAAASYPIIAAAVAVALIVAVIIYFAVERCDKKPSGMQGCIAGVIENITPAFTGSATDYVFAFSSPHDRVDVVVKQDYWDFIDIRSDYVFCSQADQSPMIACFYYNPAVCNAAVGSAVGAAVGGIAGLLIAAAAVAAIGCATWILCILALIVALIIAVAAAILGAVAGGQIGKAATPQPVLTSSGNQLVPPQALGVGDYVSEQGNLTKSGDLNGSLVFYFVTHTTLHGHSRNSPSYSHTDPDQSLVPDACQSAAPQAPIM